MNLLINVFLLSVFFPYITVIKSLDTQPTALFLGTVLFLIYFKAEKKQNRYIFYILILSILSIFLFEKSNIMMSIRGILNYWSLGIISYVSYELFKRNKIKNSIIKRSINAWFILGFIQTFYSKYFFKFLIVGMRTSDDRGVTSFATEPTFYGIICIFFGILVIENFKKNDCILFFSNLLIQILFFSKSSMVVLFLLIWISLYILKNISLKAILFSSTSLVSFHFIIINFLKDTRVYKLYIKSSDLKKLFFEDHSLNMRLSHIFYSLKGALQNFLLPNGLTQWIEYVRIETLQKTYFHTLTPTTSARIMSGFGGIIYESGLIGIIFIGIIFFCLKKGLKNKEIAIFIIIISFSAIQPSFPLNGFILGMSIFNLEKRRIHKNEKIKSNDCCRN
ncbi:hypothetical protein [Cetobacterium sp.]|uniref:hypothetical protein n=1 Tax=Cetobacterium sp. TaxID=2071632 RepID=UPI003F2AF0A5